MGTLGNWFNRIEIVHDFQLFLGCDLMFGRKESKDFCKKIETCKLYM
jgi:hypothetical protein